MRKIIHNSRWFLIIAVALACVTLQLVYPTWRIDLKAEGYPPYIGRHPLFGPSGTTFSIYGGAFTPNSTAELHIRYPDGSEQFLQDIDIKEYGYFNITHKLGLDAELGIYYYWVVDGPTQEKSNEVDCEITPQRPQGDVTHNGILVLREKNGPNYRLDVLDVPQNVGDDVATVLKDTNIGSQVEDIGAGYVDVDASSEVHIFRKMVNEKNKLYVHDLPDGNPGDTGGPVLSDTDMGKRGEFVAVGDFDGDGKDEIAVIAPKKSDPAKFQLRCYEQPDDVKGDTGPAYASDLSMGKRIRGISAGNWDGYGKDELVVLRANKVEIYAAPTTLAGSTGAPIGSARIGGSVIDKGIAAGNFDDDTNMEIALVRKKATGDDVRLMIYDAPYTLGKAIGDPIATDNNIGSGVKSIAGCYIESDGLSER